MPEINQPAPDFRFPDQNEDTVELRDFRGKQHVVLYFYPKDDTPGCTIEANQFTALAPEFAKANAVVLGVSKDGCGSHRKFIDKYGLKLRLLADTSGELCQRYGVWQEKEKNGEKRWGIVRSTFVIDRDGVLREAMRQVNADGHAQDVLERVRRL